VTARVLATFTVRRLRLITGIVLFAYVGTHFLNHALGLASLDAIEAGRSWFLLFWRAPPIGILLYLSLLVHVVLAMFAIYQRRRLLAMHRSEALQLLLGIAIVPLLAEHVIGTAYAHRFHGVEDSYTYVLLSIWHFAPQKGLMQAIALVVAWTHGCIGLHFWLRLKPWYPRYQFYLYAAALLIPVIGLLGFVNAGREVSRLATDPDWLRAAIASFNLPSAATVQGIQSMIPNTYWGTAVLLLITLAVRQVRFFVERRRGLVRITYPGGRTVAITPGPTLLEISHLHGVPHASVCGGRGRCSTCRVRVSSGIETLPVASAAEQAVLARASATPNVRLACQIRPQQDISVVPLLPASAGPQDARPRPAHLQGREREIAILFADLRGFTQLSEKKLPYDVVFVLNRYFAAMGMAIQDAGGHVDKFIGDGVMALFGATGQTDTATACRQALAAARGMGIALEALNQTLAHDLDKPLRIGIGIHVGPTIVGEMGYAMAMALTAIGDAVNTASRLESLTKEFTVELVVSEDVARHAGLDVAAYKPMETEIRGRVEKLRVRAIPRARDLPGTLTA
jgi:adenylate cyclase